MSACALNILLFISIVAFGISVISAVVCFIEARHQKQKNTPDGAEIIRPDFTRPEVLTPAAVAAAAALALVFLGTLKAQGEVSISGAEIAVTDCSIGEPVALSKSNSELLCMK